ncbi:putative nuclease with TOPRIM domain [Peptoniphilus koenoeneniae]|uniref:Nuclease with TOPRIM domain n=1 Tax=Peptoniphilus koenoeneniae TaxID=507751 RepID=A0ABU0AVG7_9FIRM|nr:hypothetical protein [Peptoniphilus koenoeneniae]MDQ0275247.1 putative nuclease with TOPRIM domain [Peptoniphilus koenoeneniae]
MKNRMPLIISSVFIIISMLLGFFSYKSYSEYSEKIAFEKTQNEKLKNELKTRTSEYEKFEEELKELEEKKLKIGEKSKELDAINIAIDGEAGIKDLKTSAINFIGANFDIDRIKSLADRGFKLKSLNSTYYDNSSVGSIEIAKINLVYNAIKFNFEAINGMNEKITVQNNMLKKREGVFNYFKNSNYLIKNYLYKGIISNKKKGNLKYNSEDFKKSNTNILALKKSLISMYDTLLMPTQKNASYLNLELSKLEAEKNNSKTVLENAKFSEDENKRLKRIYDTMIFGIDTLSQNVDYLNNYDILDKTFAKDGKNIVVRYLLDERGRVSLIQEKIPSQLTNLYYFASDGSPFAATNLNNFNIAYIKLNSKNSATYKNKGLNYLKQFKNFVK